MTVTVELDAQTEARLATAAAAQGVRPEALIRQMLETQLDPVLTPEDRLARMDARIAARQAADNTPRLPPPADIRPGETETQALFREWAAEDALLSPEEREANVAFYEDLQRSLTAEHGLRLRS